MNADKLYKDAIVIDVTRPLAGVTEYIDWWRKGGAKAIAPTVTGMAGNARTGFSQISGCQRYIR